MDLSHILPSAAREERPHSPIVAWEFFHQEHSELSVAEAKREFNELSLADRAPYLEQARRVGEEMLESSKREKENKIIF